MNKETLIKNPIRRSGVLLNRFTSGLGEHVPMPSGGSEEKIASQGILRTFEDHFGLAGGDILNGSTPRKIKSTAKKAARLAIEEEGIIDPETIVELRLVLPEDSIRDEGVIDGAIRRMDVLREVMDEEYDVDAVPNSSPIMPSYDPDSPVSVDTTWGAISTELEGFRRQIDSDPRYSKIAVIALTPTFYARNAFNGQLFFDGEPLDANRLLVLRHVGEEPRENLLLPSHLNS